ncbi:methyltransferase [Streptomyces sp. NPDC048550]|uniref:methyltransferase n=1 Tax=Streptomyces sp. NPDC048550 TaxID=3155739 RepID=UPI003414E19B
MLGRFRPVSPMTAAPVRAARDFGGGQCPVRPLPRERFSVGCWPFQAYTVRRRTPDSSPKRLRAKRRPRARYGRPGDRDRTGALALHAAGRGARVTAVEVSWPAVLTARLNALRRRLPLRVLHGDFAARTVGRRFDLILANPPYVPSPRARLPSRGPERAWDAGHDGRTVIDRICSATPALLSPGASC